MTTARAKFGAAAYADLKGKLPQPFPRTMGTNAMKYLQEVIDSGLTVDFVGRFESAFAKMMGVAHCVSAPGCTNAMQVLALALDLAPGDEVIMSPIADYGTVMGYMKANLIPVFADLELTSGNPNISAATIERCITPRTRAVVCVHKTGLMCDMDPIMTLAAKHRMIVIEDACQSAFSRYKGRYAGTIGHVGAFSFDSEKTVGSDVGGCFITNDGNLAERARFLGHSRGGEMRPGFGRIHSAAGLAQRMPSCTAAVTLAQLEIAEPNVAQRDRMARRICDGLREIPGVLPLIVPAHQDVFSCWMMGFNIDPAVFRCNVDEFARQVDDLGVTGTSTARYYLMPAALTCLQEQAKHGVYPYSKPTASRDYSYSASSTPIAEKFLDTFIRWTGFCEKYTQDHADMAVEIVRRVAEKNRK